MDDQNVSSLLTGLSSSLDKYMGTAIASQQKGADEARKSALDTQKGMQLEQYKSSLDLSKDQTMALYKQTLDGKVTPEAAASIHPKAAEVVNNFNKANGRFPTVTEADKLFDDLSKTSNKTQQSDDVRLTQWNRALSSDREFTTSRTKRDSLENVKALLDQVATQKDGPDSRQLYEQAVAQMRVLAGNGQISEKEIENLVPRTWLAKGTSIWEALSNAPVGTETQAFVARSHDFFDRESKVTNDQMDRRFKQLTAPYSDILKRNKGPASETYSQYSVNHPDYNPSTEAATDSKPGAPANRPPLDSIFGGK